MHMADWQASFFTALFFISLVFCDIARQQCHEKHSIYQMMHEGQTYKACLHGGGGPQVGEVTRLSI